MKRGISALSVVFMVIGLILAAIWLFGPYEKMPRLVVSSLSDGPMVVVTSVSLHAVAGVFGLCAFVGGAYLLYRARRRQ
jgi:hypothetical protein